jgi:hypothetical protein
MSSDSASSSSSTLSTSSKTIANEKYKVTPLDEKFKDVVQLVYSRRQVSAYGDNPLLSIARLLYKNGTIREERVNDDQITAIVTHTSTNKDHGVIRTGKDYREELIGKKDTFDKERDEAMYEFVEDLFKHIGDALNTMRVRIKPIVFHLDIDRQMYAQDLEDHYDFDAPSSMFHPMIQAAALVNSYLKASGWLIVDIHQRQETPEIKSSFRVFTIQVSLSPLSNELVNENLMYQQTTNSNFIYIHFATAAILTSESKKKELQVSKQS